MAWAWWGSAAVGVAAAQPGSGPLAAIGRGARTLSEGNADDALLSRSDSARSSLDEEEDAAAGGGDEDTRQLRLRMAVVSMPHPDKVSWGGEDAHFVSSAGGGAMGVADGVGGWHETGVNPAAYSRSLMQVAREYIEGTLDGLPEAAQASGRAEDGHIVDPRGAIRAAHMRTRVPGSSTACVIQLDRANNALVAANVGDSGFMLLRRGRMLARSRSMQHYFDCPMQLGCFPHFVEATDSAETADVYNLRVRAGDVIVAGSDGLWDNVSEREVVATVRRSEPPHELATRLVELAERHARDPEFESPYIKEALSQGLDLPWWDKLLGMSWKDGRLTFRQLRGGKQDDVTVLVARVCVDTAGGGEV